MTDREAMKLALEALEYIHEGANNQGPHTGISWRCVSNKAEPVITALRERLAQPEAPVLTGIDCSCGRKWRIVNNTLTASEPETVMAEYRFQTYAAYKTDGEMKIGVVPEPEQEPFGYFRYDLRLDAWVQNRAGLTGTPFYTSPQPSKPWVGLTDEERDYIWYTVGNSDAHGDVDGWSGRAVMDAIEAKLKEKNG